MEAWDLVKFRCFFKFQKNHNSVNFCRRQKSYLKYLYEISFSIESRILLKMSEFYMIEDLRTVRANRETNNRKQKSGEINNKYRGKCIQIEN